MKTNQHTDKKEIILTGDRATGPLHLGHYVGSLKQRVACSHSMSRRFWSRTCKA